MYTIERRFKLAAFMLSLLLFAGGGTLACMFGNRLLERQAVGVAVKTVHLDFFQPEMVAAVELVPEEPDPPPVVEEEADIALEQVVEEELEPEPEIEPDPEPEPEQPPALEPVISDASVTQDAAAEQAAVMDRLQYWVLQQLNELKYYPPSAKRIGLQGTFDISVDVADDGTVVSAEILGGKGHSLLKRALEKMLSQLTGRQFKQSIGQPVEIPLLFSFELENR